MNEMKTHICILNPKSITMGQLYGNFDEVSHDWFDGVLPVYYRHFAQNDKKDRRWLIFDGPVDAIWIENMNTVLDDNKKLCLMSGEIIAMSENMNMIFEPMDLAVASPATVSRCGMVYLEPHEMGWEPIFYSWKNRLPETFQEEHLKTINELCEVVIPPCLEFIRTSCIETTPTQDQNLVQSLLKLWRSFLVCLEDKKFFEETDKKVIHNIIESSFVFSCIWSVCVSINTEFRKPFDSYFKNVCNGNVEGFKKFQSRKILGLMFDKYGMYDLVYNPKTNEWKQWMDLVDKEKLDDFARGTQVQDIIVTTVDTIRYQFIMEHNIKNLIPTLFVGPTGTGKSVYI